MGTALFTKIARYLRRLCKYGRILVACFFQSQIPLLPIQKKLTELFLKKSPSPSLFCYQNAIKSAGCPLPRYLTKPTIIEIDSLAVYTLQSVKNVPLLPTLQTLLRVLKQTFTAYYSLYRAFYPNIYCCTFSRIFAGVGPGQVKRFDSSLFYQFFALEK